MDSKKNTKQDNLLFTLETGSDLESELSMLVEIPKGSFNKYEYSVETGQIELDRVIFEYFPYPVEYGLLPKTWDEDEDMLDIMSLVSFPTFPGCLIKVRPIGVMVFEDGGEVDDKILGVPVADVRFKDINDLSDVSQHTLDEIGFFFSHYKELQNKYKGKDENTFVKEWADKEKAIEIIKKAQRRFNEKFSS